jgi:hypothetical protein
MPAINSKHSSDSFMRCGNPALLQNRVLIKESDADGV